MNMIDDLWRGLETQTLTKTLTPILLCYDGHKWNKVKNIKGVLRLH